MAKCQRLNELYQRTAAAVVKDTEAWQDFLASACRNYKCRFDEQLLIYAQRPDASAVAEIDTWSRLFKRWVNKDSKAIAVFDRKGSRNALRYYFDISDTHEGYYGSRPVFIWKVNGKYEQLVMDRLADRFEVEEAKTLASILQEAAQNAVDDDLPDYVAQLVHCTEGSDLEKMDAYDIAVIYRRLAANSVAFMVFCRCGLDTDGYFKGEDFEDILNFNTIATVNAIGTAVSDISEVVLREISQTIRDAQIGERKQGRTFAKETANQYDKSRTEKERREGNERDHIHQAGGLPDPRPDLRTRAGASSWQVRIDAPGLSGEVQKGDLLKPSDIREPEPSSARVGADSPEAFGTNDEAARSRTGSNRGAEGKGSDPVGADDERDTESGRGSDIKGADIQLGLQDSTASGEEVTANLPTVEEQVERMMEAEEERASALSISQEDIDAFLARGSSFGNSKYRIYRQFQKREDKKSNIEFLKKEYGTGGVSYTYPDGTRGAVNYNARGISIEKQGSYTEPDMVLKWTQVEKRLRELIGDDRYLNPKEKDHYTQYLESISAPEYEIDTQEKIQRRRFINAYRELPPADKRDTLSLRLSDFIRDMDGYEKNLLSEVGRTDLSDVTAGQMEQYLSEPATVQKLIDFLALVQGRTSDVFSRSNAWGFRGELRELYPLWYLYHEGDMVYIGADQYEITALSGDKVSLRNVQFPIFLQEYSREDLEEKLEENPSNEHLKVIVTESQAEKLPAEEKADGIHFSIGFSEHPAFYDQEMKDRFTDLSFALGNKLLGILDEKQHEERADESKHVGWYKKTDFEISAVIEGEDFHYEGRFDIGDGEGDLIAHIKNFYEYSLSPDCPFIPEWKRKGEDYYREQMETFHWGQDVFVPFLEQHIELTAEDERLFAEIMETESDWFHRGEESFKEELLEKAKHWIDTFCKKEYGSDAEADYTEPSNVKLAFTTTEDELHEIQASVNLTEYRMETYIDDTLVGYTQYEDLDDLIRNALSVLDFSDLVSVTEEQLEPFYQEGSGRGTGEDEGEHRNYRITDDTLGTGTAKEKFTSNLAAIRLLHELQIESRLATPKEQETLSKYVGWGGLSMAFDERNAAWEKEYKELRYVLSEEEYRAAMESTLTAFYTPPVVIRAMYEILDRLGFSQGNILEPSCGTGNIFGLLPESMEGSMLYGIEIDSLSGGIAKQLYPKASIAVEGFENTKLPDGYFDVVLGNVPFGDFKVNDSRYNAQKFLVHDYFFAKALDKVRAGGIVLFVTSKGTMDKSSPAVRKYLAQRAELLGAIRLPDNTFKANAGTEVTSDILILQKRKRIIETEPDWIYLDTDENGITMNRYFIEHPEMILGRMKLESTRFGMDTVCKADQDVSLSGSLKEAVQKVNGEIPELDAEVDRISDSDESELSIAADPEVRNFSFTLVDGKVYFRENNRMNPAKVSMTAENRIKGLVEIRDCVRRLIKFQTDDCPEEMIRSEQMKLDNLYDAFTARYGLINSRGNYLAFAADESYFLLCSLEVLDDEGKFKRKADMFTKRTIKPHREITSVGTASEALAVSIGEKAQVDLEYMAQGTWKDTAGNRSDGARKGDGTVRKRNIAVLFRLNLREAESLDAKVKQSGLSREAYLRHLINGAVPKNAPPPDYYVMIKELHKIGNNLNQIAQKAHVLNVIDVQRYDRSMRDFEKIVRLITEAVVLPEKM